ncbi:hypothetical protein [Selenomonas ruminis]|uniref:Uncharacterized protein n=1 Tax=Selenomonas ruminis TaxID=2593411 RepID=A0A5D6W0C4_9FIRM|nr:hypothetical protein [Selenomonas sp. mPRGC5]TYZ20198.1 hypothetical protein FZ040_12175 [Selenomonas sp. mPRGC5]
MSVAAFLEKMRGLTAVIGILGAILMAMTGYTVHVFHDQQEIQGRIAVMTQTVSDWQKKADRLNGEKFRPVTEEQAKVVKSRIILAAQGNQLNLLGSADHAEENGRLCELDISGEWGNMVNFLKNFGSSDALVSIKGLAMNMEQGKIQAHVVYEIYTK